MKIKHVLYLLAMTAALIFGSVVFAHGPNSGILSGSRMGNNSNGMMGGMMSGNGMMHEGYENEPDVYTRDRSESNPYDRRTLDYGKEVESLKRQIREKRKELTGLYKSGQGNENLINRKVDELNDLELRLDETLFGRK